MLFSKNMSLLLLNIYGVAAVFKCLNIIKGRDLIFAVFVSYLIVFVAASKIRTSKQ